MTQFLDGKAIRENYVPTVFFMRFPAGTGRDAVYCHVIHEPAQPLPRYSMPTVEVVKEVFDIVGQETIEPNRIPNKLTALKDLNVPIGVRCRLQGYYCGDLLKSPELIYRTQYKRAS
ncbi:hypothetical protein MASR1M31_10210 [Porphyromonadaceae bacterium]